MWSYVTAIMMMMVTVLSMPYFNFQGDGEFGSKSEATAEEFLIYRSTVQSYVIDNPGFVGVIPDSDLTFPNGFSSSGYWRNIVTDTGLICVYGKKQTALATALLNATSNSITIGSKAEDGKFQSILDPGVSFDLPVDVPAGDLVWVVQI